jgi:hypothetical protein
VNFGLNAMTPDLTPPFFQQNQHYVCDNFEVEVTLVPYRLKFRVPVDLYVIFTVHF